MRRLIATVVACTVLVAGFAAAVDLHAYNDGHAGQSVEAVKEGGHGHLPDHCDHCGHFGGHLTGMVSEAGRTTRCDQNESICLYGAVRKKPTYPPPTPPPNA